MTIDHTTSPQSSGPVAKRRLTWSLCIATLDRIDVLERSVVLALAQTRPPKEVVIVDASKDWESHRERLAAYFDSEGPQLHYLRPPHAALTAQRNIASETTSGDILFFFDDDALMFPDCADIIVSAYEAPGGENLSAVCASNSREFPDAPVILAERKEKGAGAGLAAKISGSSVGRWIWREIFMMSVSRNFVLSDDRPLSSSPQIPALPEGIRPVVLMSGYATTVRREVALRERHEEALLAYCPGEDLDASYRFGRHGQNAVATNARVHHFEAAVGRIKRKRATALGLLNIAYVTRRHSSNLRRDVRVYYVMVMRRLLAEFLKDSLSRRWDYPQFRGMLISLRSSPTVFRLHPDNLRDWYDGLQRRILAS